MKPETKKLLKKMAIVDGIILGIIILLDVIFVMPSCGNYCFERGELIGNGAVRLIFFVDFIWGLVFYFKNRKR
jgi:hypothetical protein